MPPCCLLYASRQPQEAQRLERCRLTIPRTSGVGLCQWAAAAATVHACAHLVTTWRMLRPKKGLALTIVLALVLAQSATARVSFRFHHTAAAAAAAAERSPPALWRAYAGRSRRRSSRSSSSSRQSKNGSWLVLVLAGADAVYFCCSSCP